jgi:hypothetical protein
MRLLGHPPDAVAESEPWSMHTKSVAVAENALDLKVTQSMNRISTCTKAPLNVGEDVPALFPCIASFHLECF